MAKYEEWLKEQNLILITGWAREGLTDADIAKNMGIRRETLIDWKKKYPNIANALKEGKNVADYVVENELYKSAQTRKMKLKKPMKVKITIKDGSKTITEERIEMVEVEEVIPANVTAQIFWLKNRKPAVWRDKPDVVLSEKIEDDGLINALESKIEESIEDDSWMVSGENVNYD